MGTDLVPSIDSETKQLQDTVRARMALNFRDPTTPEGAALGGGFVVKDSAIATNLAVGKTFGLPGGGANNLRLPVNGSAVIDGSKLGPGTNDKVAYALSATFKGGFTGEAGFGQVNPGFLFGVNHFVVTGTTAGDLAGITDLYGTLNEVHQSTPGASINLVVGNQSEAGTDPSATGTTIGSIYSHRMKGVQLNTGTVTNTATTLRVEAPVLKGDATVTGTTYSLDVVGNIGLGGPIIKENASTQTSTAGLYMSRNATTLEPSITFANGTKAMNIDFTSGASGVLRILATGVASRIEISQSGTTVLKNNGANLALGSSANQGHNGLGVFHLGAAGGVPSVKPTSGVVIYSGTDGLYALGSAGTLTKLAPL
ncbi:hypothetical protein KK103_12005 [Curtobacterium flaccumfaciens pv. flaccumfaciens]|uniref:Uncharacterized protein n=1 Tax=Curtobacterium flaccumfaciens pv. flaccumfaciens TaxID=138532 RepID=A0A9Q2W721_9MICO|nr:hypothetical protein [Curtobacterium flaccumfaciens]MBT1542489.1 hypothetical protein [Curtobacterium flaccumfaciens pv. flaccumfaciens]